MEVSVVYERERSMTAAYRAIAKTDTIQTTDLERWRPEAEHLCSMAFKVGRIIDIGCGGGRNTRLLQSLGYDYFGVDVSPEMLSSARTLFPDAQFRLMDLYNPDPSLYETFDAFWATSVYLHVPRERIHEALKALRLLLKPKAVGFISLRSGRGQSTAPDGRFFCYWQETGFTKILKRHNFTVFRTGERVFARSYVSWHVMA